MKSKANSVNIKWLKEQEENEELRILLDLLKKQKELDKKLYALLTLTTTGE